jgi:hypothetical protein
MDSKLCSRKLVGTTSMPRNCLSADPELLLTFDLLGPATMIEEVFIEREDCLCQRKDALITDVPAAVIDVLRLTCRELLEIV